MKNKWLKLFLSPTGRIGRKSFVLGVVLWLAFYFLQKVWFAKTGTSTLNFYLSLIFLVLNIQIIFCVFGKRLHDIGRSTWALIGLLALVFISAVFVMLAFGGLDYFETIMQNPDKQGDVEFMRGVHETYKAQLAQNMPKVGTVLMIMPTVFTIWLALAKSHAEPNRYGIVA